jgi:hypothetical protein
MSIISHTDLNEFKTVECLDPARSIFISRSIVSFRSSTIIGRNQALRHKGTPGLVLLPGGLLQTGSRDGK